MLKSLPACLLLAVSMASAGSTYSNFVDTIAAAQQRITTIDTTYEIEDVLPDGTVTTQTLRVVFERPDRLSLQGNVVSLWCDGTNLTTIMSIPGSKSDYAVREPLTTPLHQKVENTTAGHVMRLLTPDIHALLQPDPQPLLHTLFTNRLADPIPTSLDGFPVVRLDERRALGPFSATYQRWWDPALGLIRRAEMSIDRSNRATNLSTSGTLQLRTATVNEPVDPALFTATLSTSTTVFASFPELVEAMMRDHQPEVPTGPAPDISLTTLDGKPFSLAAHRGRVVVIDFWATWCPPCVLAMPEIEKLYQRFRASNVVFLGISTDDPDDTDRIANTIKNTGVTYPIALATNDVAERYGITSIPVLLLIAPDGTIARRKVGFSPSLADSVALDIQRLLAGESLSPEPSPPPPARSTRPRPSTVNAPTAAPFPPAGFTNTWNATRIDIADFPPFERHTVATPPRTLTLAGLDDAVVLDITNGHTIARVPLHFLPRHADRFVNGMHYLADPRGGTLVVTLAWRKPMPNQPNTFMLTGGSLVGLNPDGSIRWMGGEAHSNTAIRTDAVLPIAPDRDALYITGDGTSRLIDAAGNVVAAWSDLPRMLEWSVNPTDHSLSILSPRHPLARATWIPTTPATPGTTP